MVNTGNRAVDDMKREEGMVAGNGGRGGGLGGKRAEACSSAQQDAWGLGLKLILICCPKSEVPLPTFNEVSSFKAPATSQPCRLCDNSHILRAPSERHNGELRRGWGGWWVGVVGDQNGMLQAYYFLWGSLT